MRKNRKTEVMMKQMQAQSLFFLGAALIYFILALSASTKYENFPSAQTSLTATALRNRSVSQQNQQEQAMSIKELKMGTELDQGRNITNAKNEFAKNDSRIFASATIASPAPEEEIQCFFYYLGSEEPPRPFLVSKETMKLNKTSDMFQTVTFSLSSPGKEWQLDGDFKTIVRIPSTDQEVETIFSIR